MTGPADDPFGRLLAAPRGEPVALLHSCGEGPAYLFERPVDVLSIPDAPAALDRAFERLDEFLARHAGRPCAGFLGYGLRDAVEPLPRLLAPDPLAAPALFVAAFESRRAWSAPLVPPPPPSPSATSMRALVGRRDYEARVARVVEHIRAGDFFQANLTQPVLGQFDGDPRALFWKLCAASPAPFAGYLETGDGLAVLSSSPEEFLQLEGRAARTQPIKGTRPRGSDPGTDAALLRELLASEKDLAELAMIVDLLRNDLGKSADIGSVRVGPFPEPASYAQVHHLFATVTATVRAGVSIGELIGGMFPGGSITGAPKLRCMERLEELEVLRRGVYTGAVGWFGPGPRLHLNVAIRTMVWRDGMIRLDVGGGVTSDSDPGAEYEETLHKAAGMLKALDAELDVPKDGPA